MDEADKTLDSNLTETLLHASLLIASYMHSPNEPWNLDRVMTSLKRINQEKTLCLSSK